ncbi:hypothetical protein ACQY0O_006983 [Thecaphora frezii]
MMGRWSWLGVMKMRRASQLGRRLGSSAESLETIPSKSGQMLCWHLVIKRCESSSRSWLGILRGKKACQRSSLNPSKIAWGKEASKSLTRACFWLCVGKGGWDGEGTTAGSGGAEGSASSLERASMAGGGDGGEEDVGEGWRWW